MEQTKFTLSWDAYQKSFCAGLGSLQQNEEFVDMTLAADGHHVKVHQLVLSVVSPYLKALITSINCPHPVVFLNKISYKTLCYILEYVYTGEVVVAEEDINDLVEAAQALKIKGLEDMKLGNSLNTSLVLPHISTNTTHYQNVSNTNEESVNKEYSDQEIIHEDTIDDDHMDDEYITIESTDTVPLKPEKNKKDIFTEPTKKRNKVESQISKDVNCGALLYTLSVQGSLQLILNRFMYCLRYIGRRGSRGGSTTRRWRCVDYNMLRCPASVITKDNVVVQRSSAHIHPFHDTKILKKIRNGAVYTAIPDAEKKGDDIKKNKPPSNETPSSAEETPSKKSMSNIDTP
ncbi:modifier of mdg4-like [Galleria mellonella]|uniref:Modifier of mdg4-like n=1 Tax=Galleria mellonella TaxID=7137 RepID=A0ABM3MUB5_GALME|nr:modifier of mdg4-like [Galleria mellonella]